MAKLEFERGGYFTKLDSGERSVLLEVYEEDMNGSMCDNQACFVPLNDDTVSFLETVCKEYRAKKAGA